jgi:enoyl-CoA hydratase/carnithine racemase
VTVTSKLTQSAVSMPSPGYWRVVFSNPPINMLNSTTVLGTRELVEKIEEAPDLKVVVFASEQADFCMARYDLSDTDPVAFAPTDFGITHFIDSTFRLNQARAITIACIRARVRGGGSEFALACDLRFDSRERALLGQPEVGVGIVPGGGAVERLTGLVGRARALEVIAGSDDYDGAAAELYGWVNRALPDDQLDEFVDRYARRLASFDAHSLAATKRLIARHATPLEDYRETLDALSELFTADSTNDRLRDLARRAHAVGPDFELRLGSCLDPSYQVLPE